MQKMNEIPSKNLENIEEKQKNLDLIEKIEQKIKNERNKILN